MIKNPKYVLIRQHLSAAGYSLVKTLGSGAFGEVVLAQKDGVEYAIKCISKRLLAQRPQLEKYVRNEHRVMKALEHPNIIREITTFDNKEYFSMVLEYCNLGNLYNYQHKRVRKSFTIHETVLLAYEVIKGLQEIHANKFIHRDIKPENILLKNQNGTVTLKIADFGFARPIESVVGTHCGTCNFMAPEILAHKPYDVSVDVWSLGVLMYFMIFNEYPFASLDPLQEMQNKCGTGYSLYHVNLKKQKLDLCTPELADLFNKIFVLDPRKRIDLNGICKHVLFAETVQILKKNSQSTIDSPRVQESQYKSEQAWTNLQFQKADFLKIVSHRINNNYASLLKLKEYQKHSVCFFLLRTAIFYLKTTARHLRTGQKPESELNDWVLYCQTEHAEQSAQKLDDIASYLLPQLQTLSARLKALPRPESRSYNSYYPTEDFFQSTEVKDLQFEDFKMAYRSVIGVLFKQVHQNENLSTLAKNRMKLELFCCHLINRVFQKGYFEQNFEKAATTLGNQFQCQSFINWCDNQSRDTLDQMLLRLHKKYMSSK